MKVVGILSAYDESPAWLAATVTGFARVCDAIVYADGAYVLLPGARPCSHPEQAEAVVAAAEAAGVECLVHRPSSLYFGNEVEKRNKTLDLAAALDPTWVLVFDADCHVFKCEPEIVRWELEHTDKLIASYTALDSADYLADADLAELTAKDDVPVEWTVRTNDIYRWHPSLRYGPQHWIVSRDIGGRRRWLRGSFEELPDCLNLDGALAVYHRSNDRAFVRRRAQEGYYHARELHGVEELAPGDPAANGIDDGDIQAKPLRQKEKTR